MGAAAGAAALALTSVLLTGCLAASTEKKEADPDPAPSRSASSPAPTESTASEGDGDLTFERGADIKPGTITQWSDGMVDEEDWQLSSPDNGQGGWAYSTTDGACTASFWQGAVHDMVAEDDREASDFLLAALLNVKPADLQGKIGDGTFSHRVSGQGSVDQRFVQGKVDDGTTWIFAARGFAQTKSAVYVDVRCTTGDVSKAAALVWKENAVIAE